MPPQRPPRRRGARSSNHSSWAASESSAETLVAVCAAGVPDKTLGALYALEATAFARCPRCVRFDLLVAVSPFPGDRTADYAEAAGLTVLRQPAPLGLSDLWNRVVRFAFFSGRRYQNLILSNNDVLVPAGAVGSLVQALGRAPNQVAVTLTQRGGGVEPLGGAGRPLAGADPDLVAFAEHPVNFMAVQARLSCAGGGGEGGGSSSGGEEVVSVQLRKSFTGFFWGLAKSAAASALLADGSGRLFNTTARLNFGQEAELLAQLKGGVNLHLSAYVHHFRGQTLGGCQNGHKDCAHWQEGHRADASFHINEYTPPRPEAPRAVPWWEPAFGGFSPTTWRPTR